MEVQGYEWKLDGSCYGLEYKLELNENPFFLEGPGVRYNMARRYCSGCPVVVDCLIDALEDLFGFKGCMTEGQRKAMRSGLNAGRSFKLLAEEIWKPHRGTNMLVPPESVWKEWCVQSSSS